MYKYCQEQAIVKHYWVFQLIKLCYAWIRKKQVIRWAKSVQQAQREIVILVIYLFSCLFFHLFLRLGLFRGWQTSFILPNRRFLSTSSAKPLLNSRDYRGVFVDTIKIRTCARFIFFTYVKTETHRLTAIDTDFYTNFGGTNDE